MDQSGDEVRRYLRKSHNEELRVLYFSPNINRRSNSGRWDGRDVWHVGREEKCTKGVCRVTWRTELHGRRKHRRDYNIKMDHKEIAGPDVDWIDVSQNRSKWRVIVNTVMKLGFYRIWGVTWRCEKLLVSQEGLCCFELEYEELCGSHLYTDRYLKFFLLVNRLSFNAFRHGKWFTCLMTNFSVHMLVLLHMWVFTNPINRLEARRAE
jgi:hypothetical protein